MIKQCLNCKQEKEHHAKGLCYACYKKLKYTPKVDKCKRCKRKMPVHAKGLCPGCYNYVFHADKNKAYSQRKTSGIDVKTFRKTTTKCVVCGFDKIVDIHHIDGNKKNNLQENLIGLCPNHHRMINNYKYRHEIFARLVHAGYKLPFDDKIAFHKGQNSP